MLTNEGIILLELTDDSHLQKKRRVEKVKEEKSGELCTDHSKCDVP